ncbi:ankyrin repeat family A protein 2-like isoform X2 [Argiope bruennichi]|uniref:ankyrin repeat family A protein 2-like isoform X2 n=1 Tax=Argiope bruennichi TaxID=94029 RepID=UPI0024945341|nr:ankyrin repeat family A protein 2-like isoform X2 [Argiope bruennichi]
MPSSIFVKKENEDSQPSVSFSSAMGISSLNRDGSRSAFTPYKPTTVLTNLQRGNVQTQTPAVLPAMNDSFDPNQTDQNGLTPLMWASSYGQLATVQKLISCGASISTIGDSGENALILASSAGHSVIVKELINQGASLDYRDQEGNTALMYAVYNNRAGCVQELLNAGADMTIVNEALESAYEIAIKKRCREAQTVMEKHMLNLMQADVNLVQVKTEPL